MEDNRSQGGRIGIFGGTFDPPHMAHLRMAKLLCDFASLEKVLWIPTRKPPHKSDRVVTPASVRLKMVKEVVSGMEGHDACDIEILRSGYSYTIDTLRALKKLYPGKDLVLIMGSDQFCELSEWKESESLTDLVEICVLPRKGATVSSSPADNSVLAPFEELDISSSEIRNKIQQNLSFKHLVCKSVAKIIEEEGLYQS